MLPSSNAMNAMSTIAIGFILIATNLQPSFSQHHSQGRDLIEIHRRHKREIACINNKTTVTEALTIELTLPALYTAIELDACLSNSLLERNLTQLGLIAFGQDQLLVLMMKLSQIYPNGVPEEVIRKLGFIITVYGPEEITTWNITMPTTLILVLRNSPNMNTTGTVLQNYLGRSGPLTAAVLSEINGPVLCSLSEANLRTIVPEELRKASPLNISTCTQPKKNIIYGIAATAFQNETAVPSVYFPLIEPYLPGAPLSALQSLSTQNINMNYTTFRNLNPDVVEKLTAAELRGLLGINLMALKNNENDLIVQRWVRTHSPFEVNSLGVNLVGGLKPFGLGNINIDMPPSSASMNCYSILLSAIITAMGVTLPSIL
ncbi:mesothelin [Amblyraja radiata]|uniref:mesothelin n=1 Tax=Amblyraja radiata TaxID=386614 RepID=UPI001402BBC8|nr:mesothelin [Amblyraja radiata]